MSDAPKTAMTFATLDQAESALDWIGLDFADGDGCFEGELAAEDADLLDAVLEDPETPGPVRELAAALRDLATSGGLDDDADDGGEAIPWRVAFTA